MSPDPHSHESTDSVELPTPTMWPIITAFGLTLVFAGIVTDYYVSLVGFICALIGGIGWFTEVFPHPKHEAVAFVPVEKRVTEICREGRTVSLLHAGEDGHREHIVIGAVHPYSAGIVGGLLGGVAMAVVACVWGLISVGSIWFPVNLLAAAGLPELSSAAMAGEAGMKMLTSFHFVGLIVALVIHVTSAAMVGLLYTVLLPMLPAKNEWLWGGIITPLIWTSALWATLRYVNPGLNAHINWIAFVASQIAFGLVCGFYVYRSANIAVQKSWPLAHRLGVEAQHRNSE